MNLDMILAISLISIVVFYILDQKLNLHLIDRI